GISPRTVQSAEHVRRRSVMARRAPGRCGRTNHTTMARLSSRPREGPALQFGGQESNLRTPGSKPGISTSRNYPRIAPRRAESSRGDWTPLELLIAGVRGWEGHLQRRLDDGKPFRYVA